MALSSRYGTNHPRDRAARRMQAMQKATREQGCTRRQLDDPSEPNIRHCMKEMKYMAKSGEDYKACARFLGEDTNLDKHRRSK